MTNKELIKALNEADMRAIDEGTQYYDLKELYEAVQMTAQEKAELAKKVQDAKSDEDYAEIHGFLNAKLGNQSGIKTEAFEDEFDFNDDGSVDYTNDEDKWIHTYEVVFFDKNGQVDTNRSEEFNDEEEAIEFAEDNDADAVTDWFYDKEDPEIPNYSEYIWKKSTAVSEALNTSDAEGFVIKVDNVREWSYFTGKEKLGDGVLSEKGFKLLNDDKLWGLAAGDTIFNILFFGTPHVFNTKQEAEEYLDTLLDYDVMWLFIADDDIDMFMEELHVVTFADYKHELAINNNEGEDVEIDSEEFIEESLNKNNETIIVPTTIEYCCGETELFSRKLEEFGWDLGAILLDNDDEDNSEWLNKIKEAGLKEGDTVFVELIKVDDDEYEYDINDIYTFNPADPDAWPNVELDSIEEIDESLNEGNDNMSDDEILNEIAGTLEIKDVEAFKNDVKSGNGKKYNPQVQAKCCDTCKARFKKMLGITNESFNINEDAQAQAVVDLARAAARTMWFQPWKAKELINGNPRIVQNYLKSGLTADEYLQKQIDYYGIKQYSNWFANGMKERYPNEYEEPKRTFTFEAFDPAVDKEADDAVDFLLNRIESAQNHEQLASIYDMILLDEDNLSEANYKKLLDAVETKINSLE